MLDFVVDLRVRVEYSLGMDFPEAICGGYTKYCRTVDPGGDWRNIGNLDYDGTLDNCRVLSSCNPCRSGGDLGDRGKDRSFGARD